MPSVVTALLRARESAPIGLPRRGGAVAARSVGRKAWRVGRERANSVFSENRVSATERNMPVSAGKNGEHRSLFSPKTENPLSSLMYLFSVKTETLPASGMDHFMVAELGKERALWVCGIASVAG